MNESISLFWFRNDLRVNDNPGLFEAAKAGKVLPVYIFDQEQADGFQLGAASRWWLHYSLASLNQSLEGILNIYQGNAANVILRLVEQYKVSSVYWSRCYEATEIAREAELTTFLKRKGINARSFNASLLWEPWEVLKADGEPYQKFTPFYQKVLSQADVIRVSVPSPSKKVFIYDDTNKTRLEDLELLSKKNWELKLQQHCKVGEKAAHQKLINFLKKGLPGYQQNRDYPNKLATSNLSPHLHFGEISPQQIWHAVQKHTLKNLRRDGNSFLRELAWREFSYSLLYYFPNLPRENFQKKFDRFPWVKNSKLLLAWQQGTTGYPLVDAGMRELWQTGTMHNRLRMITASFLVKNLLIDWREGAAWFLDTLVDADLANNSVNWQWVAGSGMDASPYFRIFNPVLQGEKFDKEGMYTRHFVPELAKLPKRFLFKPWEAPEEILKIAGVTLGKNYPYPIVDLSSSRDRSLKAYLHL